MLTISLIVFTDHFQGHVYTFYSKWYFITYLFMNWIQMIHLQGFKYSQGGPVRQA